MQFENRIYSRAELREREIDTGDYAIMTEAEEVEGTLLLKADARNRMVRLFFVLSDGRKILTPVFWWQRSKGFFDLEVGARYRLSYVPGKDGYAKLGSATLEGGE
jgi:hypothetical protein